MFTRRVFLTKSKTANLRGCWAGPDVGHRPTVATSNDLSAGASFHCLHSAHMSKRPHELLDDFHVRCIDNHVESVASYYGISLDLDAHLGCVLVRDHLQQRWPHLRVASLTGSRIMFMLCYVSSQFSSSISNGVNLCGHFTIILTQGGNHTHESERPDRLWSKSSRRSVA